ncbi:MAG: hypothetical protein ACRDH5_10885, partial [bacterium]
MRARRVEVILVTAALLAAAATPASSRAAPTGPATWTPWVIDSAAEFRVGPPPKRRSQVTRKELRRIERLQGHLSKKQRRLIKRWNKDAATLPWTEVALDMILIHRPAAFPTRSARIFGLLHVGMFDAVVAASDSRSAYERKRPFRVDGDIERLARARGSSYPDINAAVAGAAGRLLAYLFPNEPASTFIRLANQATDSRVWAGVSYPSDVAQGRLIGRQVAEQVIAYGEADGHTNPAGPILAARTCVPTDCGDPAQEQWVPTPFHYQYPPTDPAASTWRTYLLATPSQFRPPLPYPYGSPQFCAELAEVKTANDTADETTKQLGFFWDDGPGTYSPAGHWNDIAVDTLRN